MLSMMHLLTKDADNLTELRLKMEQATHFVSVCVHNVSNEPFSDKRKLIRKPEFSSRRMQNLIVD